jgi:hypothetical protein
MRWGDGTVVVVGYKKRYANAKIGIYNPEREEVGIMETGPLSVEEIRDLLTMIMHGPLPNKTMDRIFTTLVEYVKLKGQRERAGVVVTGFVQSPIFHCPFTRDKTFKQDDGCVKLKGGGPDCVTCINKFVME